MDLRHPEPGPLARDAGGDSRRRGASTASGRGCELAESEIWRIEPIAFDERLVAAAREESGTGRVLASGALHDAAEMARHLPVAMIFAPSLGGISHAPEEDTREEDLERAIEAFGRLALRVARGELL